VTWDAGCVWILAASVPYSSVCPSIQFLSDHAVSGDSTFWDPLHKLPDFLIEVHSQCHLFDTVHSYGARPLIKIVEDEAHLIVLREAVRLKVSPIDSSLGNSASSYTYRYMFTESILFLDAVSFIGVVYLIFEQKKL